MSAPTWDTFRTMPLTALSPNSISQALMPLAWRRRSLVTVSREGAATTSSGSTGGSPLTLYYRGETLALGESSDRLQLGRDSANGLTVDGSHVSRSHATIEPRRGKFFLLDHSTNGTYVVFEGRAPVYLRRELLQLVGQGVISLGQLPSENESDTIRFVWGDSQDSEETPLPQKILGRS